MVHYLRLEILSKCKVDRICQSEQAGLKEIIPCVQSGHFIGGKGSRATSGRTADVFEPMTGDVQAKVALASKAESPRCVGTRARAAGMGCANPQRRARVMMKFVELVQRDTMTAREMLARDTADRADAKGDSSAAWRSRNFACGIRI